MKYSLINLFIHSLDRYFLSVDYVPGTVLGFGDTVVNQPSQVPALMSFPLMSVLLTVNE